MPNVFEELQVHEFQKLLDGYEARRKEEDYRRAYFISWLIAPHVKEQITADQIIEPLWGKKTTSKEDETYMRDLFKLPKGGK